MKKYNMAIVGATGLVGHEFIKVLLQRDFPMASIKLLASDRSAGRKLTVGEQELEVQETAVGSFEGVDIALFSAGSDISHHFSPIAAEEGATVVDNSAAWRMDPQVPLVVPEVNADVINEHTRFITSPNCSTIQLVVALAPLHKAACIKRIIVATYQSTSGWGLKGPKELCEQTPMALQSLEKVSFDPAVFPKPIAFNCIPHIEPFLDGDYTR